MLEGLLGSLVGVLQGRQFSVPPGVHGDDPAERVDAGLEVGEPVEGLLLAGLRRVQLSHHVVHRAGLGVVRRRLGGQLRGVGGA